MNCKLTGDYNFVFRTMFTKKGLLAKFDLFILAEFSFCLCLARVVKMFCNISEGLWICICTLTNMPSGEVSATSRTWERHVTNDGFALWIFATNNICGNKKCLSGNYETCSYYFIKGILYMYKEHYIMSIKWAIVSPYFFIQSLNNM